MSLGMPETLDLRVLRLAPGAGASETSFIHASPPFDLRYLHARMSSMAGSNLTQSR